MPRPTALQSQCGWTLSPKIMFIGEYEHTLDEKKRVSLPKAFAKQLGKKMVLTRGLDSCLFLFSASGWQKVADKLQGLSFAAADTRGFNRFLLSGAVEVEADSAGRILMSDVHKIFAGLKKDVIFAGVSDRVEIWDSESWNSYKQKIEKQADAMAEKLGELGAL
jgi:MraZ protein